MDAALDMAVATSPPYAPCIVNTRRGCLRNLNVSLAGPQFEICDDCRLLAVTRFPEPIAPNRDPQAKAQAPPRKMGCAAGLACALR
jgi:hypothetical protein